MKALKGTKSFLFSSWKAKRAADKVEPLLSSGEQSAIFSGLGVTEDSTESSSPRASTQPSQSKPYKARKCPVWVNVASIVAGVLALLVVLLILFLYWRPDGWRDDGKDDIKWTLIATIGGGVVAVLSCLLITWCCYCLVCHGEFWQRRKWKKYMDREEQEMQSMGNIEDRHQRARDERKVRSDAYRARAYALMKS